MPATERKISKTCEVIVDCRSEPVTFCAAATAFWYPAQGGATMALCETHAQPHALYVHPYVRPSRLRSSE